jgi:hypothetical protein
MVNCAEQWHASDGRRPDAALSREEIDQLADEIAVAAAHIDAATYALLRDIERFDAAGDGPGRGHAAWRIGSAGALGLV